MRTAPCNVSSLLRFLYDPHMAYLCLKIPQVKVPPSCALTFIVHLQYVLGFIGSLFSATKQKHLFYLFRSFRFKFSPSGISEFLKFPVFWANSQNDRSKVLQDCLYPAALSADLFMVMGLFEIKQRVVSVHTCSRASLYLTGEVLVSFLLMEFVTPTLPDGGSPFGKARCTLSSRPRGRRRGVSAVRPASAA